MRLSIVVAILFLAPLARANLEYYPSPWELRVITLYGKLEWLFCSIAPHGTCDLKYRIVEKVHHDASSYLQTKNSSELLNVYVKRMQWRNRNAGALSFDQAVRLTETNFLASATLKACSPHCAEEVKLRALLDYHRENYDYRIQDDSMLLVNDSEMQKAARNLGITK